MTQIEQLLRDRIGLDPASVGSGSIQRIVRLRMKALGISQPQDYARLISTPGAEWTEFVEAIVVTETWFFRDRDPFAAFVSLVHKEHLVASSTTRLRILSVPCASGEEPYSLAMSLIEAGLPLQRFQIDAADLSPRALARAKSAVYRRHSFRGQYLAFRDRYFHHTNDGYALDPVIRKAVHFFEGNLLSPDFLQGHGGYDFIFCRNLLIYFDRDTQAKAFQTIDRLLLPSGLLMVGAAEQPIALENRFVSANVPMAFACRKAGAAVLDGAHRPRPAKSIKVAQLEPPPFHQSAREAAGALHDSPLPRFDHPGEVEKILRPGPPSRRPAVATEFQARARLVADLENARRLADAGQLAEASSLCEAHLLLNPGAAQAWYLLGLIRDAAADPSALECYRKALYLDPNHYETLLQMAFLSEKSGDAVRARTFKERASRIKNLPAVTREPIRA